MGSIKKDTISGVKWSAIENISVQGVTFIIGLVLARLLLPSDYGIIGMLGIFIAIGQTFVNSGFSNALIRKPDRTELDCTTAFYFNVVVGIVCSVLMFISAPLIAKLFNQLILTPVCRAMSLTIFLYSLTIVQVALLSIDVNFRALAKVNLVCTLISGILGIACAYRGYGVWSLVYQQIVFATLRVPFLWIVSHWRPQMHFSWSSFYTLFSYGSKLLASGLIHTLYSHVSTFVIGKYFTVSELGYFTRGNSMAYFPATNIMGIIQRVSFPILSKLQYDDESLVFVYRKYIRLSSIPIFIVMVLLIATARPLINVLLSEKWDDAVIFLQLFCIAYMFDHISKLNLNLLQVKGRSDLFLRLEIVKKIIGFSLIIASIPFGVLAIAISKVIYSQIALFINTYYAGKLFGMGYMSQMKDFFKYLLASIIACVIPFVLCYHIYINPIIEIGISIVLAISLYCLLLWKDDMFRELMYVIIPNREEK